jgi:hypothetical protein
LGLVAQQFGQRVAGLCVHSRAVWSKEAVTTDRPSGLNSALMTTLSCLRGCRLLPVLGRPDARPAVTGSRDNPLAVGLNRAFTVFGCQRHCQSPPDTDVPDARRFVFGSRNDALPIRTKSRGIRLTMVISSVNGSPV